MHIEYEIKVLDINASELRKLFSKIDATQIGKYEFRRYIFALDNENEWIRLRTDGKLTTLTYKNAEKDSIDAVKELEIDVSSFEDTKQLLELTGLKAKSYEENEREEYGYKNASLTIDTWPGIPSYMEIESDSKESVEELLKELNLDNHFTTSKTVADIYAHYKVPMKNSINSK